MIKSIYQRFLGWLFYRWMVYISRNVTFQDFTRVWNEAYHAHQEAEWKRLKSLMDQGTSLGSTNAGQVEQGAYLEATRSERQYGPTWPRQGSVDGQEEKQQRL